MFFGEGKKKKMKSDKPICRLGRLLDELKIRHIDCNLKELEVKAIVCNDGVVLLNLDSKGYGVSMIRDVIPINFSLNLTNEEMQDFNGGKGLRERYFEFRN